MNKTKDRAVVVNVHMPGLQDPTWPCPQPIQSKFFSRSVCAFACLFKVHRIRPPKDDEVLLRLGRRSDWTTERRVMEVDGIIIRPSVVI